jgi:phosphoenolpyruvate carboxykinase (GTP)
VLKWVVERLEGTVGTVETPIGLVPTAGTLDVEGLDMTPEQVEAALSVDPEEWKAEIPLIEEWFAKIGETVPTSLRDELDSLKLRLGLN